MEMNVKLDFPDEETCWQAVLARDARYNGVIYFAVRSTGVYCRPTCPSRRPRRDRVAFFASPEAAEAAGFRPCKRCYPRDAVEPRVALVQEAVRLIEAAEESVRLDDLAKRLNVSLYYFHRTFKAVTGLTPRQYAASQRAQRFKVIVRKGLDVSGALYEAGYSSSSRLYEDASGRLGMTPASYRFGGKNMSIHYTIVDSPLGRLLVAGTERGICQVSFGEDDARLVDELHKEFSAAQIRRDEAALASWVSAIVNYLQGQRPSLDLPLDVQATAFKMRVWEELRHIPYGQTRTYSQVAQAIGHPKAVRAVANACATNPAALVTPCHRVLRKDGSLGGYRWGLERKQKLLQMEKSHPAADDN
jgi:AraC family transcriptional regulator of adaptative response/methylated-DNA-[protein]-cysteine methyltransferase